MTRRGNESDARPYTHAGSRPHVGRGRLGRRGVHGAGDDRPGVVHALNRSRPWGRFAALCGVSVDLDDGQVEPNVRPAAEASVVTCERCLAASAPPLTPHTTPAPPAASAGGRAPAGRFRHEARGPAGPQGRARDAEGES